MMLRTGKKPRMPRMPSMMKMPTSAPAMTLWRNPILNAHMKQHGMEQRLDDQQCLGDAVLRQAGNRLAQKKAPSKRRARL